MRDRLDKVERLRAAGIDPYSRGFQPTHGSEAAKALLGDAERTPQVAVAGRLMIKRQQGGLVFADLQDGQGRIQLMANRSIVGDEEFARFADLDLGDIIGVSGPIFRTKRGEITVEVHSFQLLTKSLRPLPEKWHGLKDIEIRYRQRYVDLVVNREVRDVFVKRSLIVRELRRFLDERGYLEVETPILHPIAGGALAKPFKTHHNALDMPLYLRIAQELYLKRLIVGGLNRVYDLNRIFRNEGISTRHNPEFTMLEFYQAYSNYTDLMDLTEEMLTGIAEKVCGSKVITYDDLQIDFRKWTRLSMKEAILKFSAEKIDEDKLRDRAAVEALLEHLHAEFDPRLPLGNLIGILFETVAEQHLVQPTFIYDYPVELSPLSKRKASDPSLVERFELYIGGMEIANGYSELNDPMDQKERFLSQLKERDRGDEEAHQMDEDYIRALSYGMPPTAGEGIGVDRLTMLLTNSTSIRDVILFPHLRAE